MNSGTKHAVRVIYTSYEPLNLMQRSYSKWTFAFWELSAAFSIGFILACLL